MVSDNGKLVEEKVVIVSCFCDIQVRVIRQKGIGFWGCLLGCDGRWLLCSLLYGLLYRLWIRLWIGLLLLSMVGVFWEWIIGLLGKRWRIANVKRVNDMQSAFCKDQVSRSQCLGEGALYFVKEHERKGDEGKSQGVKPI